MRTKYADTTFAWNSMIILQPLFQFNIYLYYQLPEAKRPPIQVKQGKSNKLVLISLKPYLAACNVTK